MLLFIGVLCLDASVALMQTLQRRVHALCITHVKPTSITTKTTLLLGHHTLGIDCKGVMSTGVDRMLVGNRVGVGLTRSTINSFAPIQISHHGSEKKTVLMVVSPLWRGLGILGFT